uniref:hypothetical protein n=1 Tax=Pantoea vagans TaxID=470934 RepID=UPI00289A4EA5|nr:hypothetical protein [Pantoea vagans]
MAVNVSPQGKAALERTLSAEGVALSTLMAAGKLGLANRQQEATAFLMTTARPAQKVLLEALNYLTDTEMKLSYDTVSENSARTSRTAVNLMRTGVYRQVQFTPDTAFFLAVFFHLPLTFTEDF